VGDVEFERRVEEEARALEDRFRKHNGSLEDSWIAAVRPLVERLAAAEGAATTWKGRADQLIESLAAGKVRATLGAAPEESALEAAERTAGALASVRGELARETEARQAAAERVKDLEARVIAQDAEIRAAQDETRRAWVRVTAAEDIVAAAQAALDEAGIIDVGQEPLLGRLKRMIADANAESDRTMAAELKSEGLTGERDEALSTVRRYRVQLAHVVGREATLRAALADARAGLRSMARELLGVDAGRAVVEVGS
jgi:hypothetical protein